MKITRVGIDLAKELFQVHGVDGGDKTVVRRRLRRGEMTTYFKKLPPCLIGMEACASSHHWARILSGQGHTVKLIAPQFVKPYVKGNKNDANDAEGICEAVGRSNLRFVAIKTVEQQMRPTERPNMRVQSTLLPTMKQCLQTGRSPYTPFGELPGTKMAREAHQC